MRPPQFAGESPLVTAASRGGRGASMRPPQFAGESAYLRFAAGLPEKLQ